jgi:peptidoglycan/xylan/chitin deacetylase (PgdA/CDA1 family)
VAGGDPAGPKNALLGGGELGGLGEGAGRPGEGDRSQEGHTVGNHSWDHPDLTTLDRGQVESELQDTDDVIEQVTGTTPTQWRPPYGATNPAVEAAAAGVGLTSMVLWTVDPHEWANLPATTVRDRVLQAVRPDSIILLHDGTGANTPEALPMILNGLADMGYCAR